MRDLSIYYKLKEGMEIKVQISAINAIGESDVGQCTACNMRAPPGNMSKPNITTDPNVDFIAIRFNHAIGCVADNSWEPNPCTYTVTMYDDNKSQQYKGLDQLTWRMPNAKVPGSTYCFTVQAVNDCGVSNRSEEVCQICKGPTEYGNVKPVITSNAGAL